MLSSQQETPRKILQNISKFHININNNINVDVDVDVDEKISNSSSSSEGVVVTDTHDQLLDTNTKNNHNNNVDHVLSAFQKLVDDYELNHHHKHSLAPTTSALLESDAIYSQLLLLISELEVGLKVLVVGREVLERGRGEVVEEGIRRDRILKVRIVRAISLSAAKRDCSASTNNQLLFERSVKSSWVSEADNLPITNQQQPNSQ